MAYETIAYEETDGAAIIRLDRPDKLNAISTTMREELVSALERAEVADGIRAAVVTGNGRAFSAGYDFGESGGEQGSLEDYMTGSNHDYLRTFLDVDIPVVAAVNGLAFAGACNLCLYCDITIAAESAEFGYPEMHMAAIPGPVIDPYVGMTVKHAKELYFSGRRIDAREAERMGMINRAVPDDDLWDEVWDLVDGITYTPPEVVALMKIVLNEAIERAGFRFDGKLDHVLWSATMVSETRRRFAEIVGEEGVNAGIEWMHEVEKEKHW